MTKIGTLLAPGTLTRLRADLRELRAKADAARADALGLLNAMFNDRQADTEDKDVIGRIVGEIKMESRAL